MNGKLSGIDDADIGLTVSEHEAAAQTLVRGLAADQTAGGKPTLAKIGGPARTNLAECRAGRGPDIGTRMSQWQDGLDAVVEDHQGDPVTGSETVDSRQGGLTGARPLVTAHRPRAVERQGQVDRGALAAEARDAQSQVQKAFAQTGRADQSAVGVQREPQPVAGLRVRRVGAVSVGRDPDVSDDDA